MRVLHAKVRQRLRGRKYWKREEWGVPINQEDMAATLLAFSYNVLVGIELIGGAPLPEQQQEDYLALWRYIGWLLGVDSTALDPCRDAGRAKAMLESIVMHLLEPDKHSVAVAHHLLKAPGASAWGYRAVLCRRFLGDPLSDALRLPTGCCASEAATAECSSSASEVDIGSTGSVSRYGCCCFGGGCLGGWEWPVSAAQLWTLRMYTSLGRWRPTRQLLCWMHGHGLTLFHGKWSLAPRPKRAGAAAGQRDDRSTSLGGCPFE